MNSQLNMTHIILFIIVCLFYIACNHSVTIHPQKKSIIETVYASGKIISNNEYYLYALSNGTVTKKNVKEGDTIIKGQVLFVINYDASQAAANAAHSNYENIQHNLSAQSRLLNDIKLTAQNAQTKFSSDSLQYFRLKNLWQQNIGTKGNLDNAYSNYLVSLNQKKSAEEKYYSTVNDLNVSLQQAKSQLTSAQTDLNNYFIRSQNNGIVYQTLKEAGESVHASEPVALLGDSKKIIKLSVDQQDIDKIKPGKEILLKTDISGDSIYHGFVTRIYPLMNESDQTFRVDAEFMDNLRQPFIHSSVEANIIIQKKNNALIIPRKAMIGQDSVQIKQNGEVKTIAVRTGILTLNDIEILSGLNESSEVILPGKK